MDYGRIFQRKVAKSPSRKENGKNTLRPCVKISFNDYKMAQPLIIRQSWLDHEGLIMNLYGRPLPASTKLHHRGIKLWDEIQSFNERFVVDNHQPWERYARLRANERIAFILGTTVLNERSQLLSVFEDSKGQRKVFHNVFLFGAENLEVNGNGYIFRGRLVLDRLDDAMLSLKDREKLRTLGDFCSPQSFSNPKEEPDPEILRLNALITEGADALLKRIQDDVPHCFRDYRKSVTVARACLALLLTKNPDARRRYENQGSVNSFSDAGLIKDALFFHAGILSNDNGVRKMAGYCRVKALGALPIASERF
jgi:hypothetical protein